MSSEYHLSLFETIEILKTLKCRIFKDEEIKALIVRHPMNPNVPFVLPDAGPDAAESYEVAPETISHIIFEAENQHCFTRYEFRTVTIRVKRRMEVARVKTEQKLRTRLHELIQELKASPREPTDVEREELEALRQQIRTVRPRVFLSHTKVDKPAVEAYGAWMRYRGAKVFLDEWSLRPGESIIERLEREIENTDQIVVFLSKESVESGWVKREIAMGTFLELGL